MGKKIIVLSPHTDDGELGCGATVAKAINNGDEVFYFAFTGAERSVPEGYPPNILRMEVKESTRVLGIKPENVDVLNYPVREFNTSRQDILEDLVQMNKQVNPDLVFIPSLRDRHQDHQVIANEGFRAFKSASILSYELPWNNIDFTAHSFVEMDEKLLRTKMDSLNCYKSQSHRPYMTEAFIHGWASMRGVQCGKSYAEAFEVLRIYL